MRGSFIIHAVIDVLLVAVFMLHSQQIRVVQLHSPAKQCSPQIMLGVGFQLPLSKPHSVHIVVLLGK